MEGVFANKTFLPVKHLFLDQPYFSVIIIHIQVCKRSWYTQTSKKKIGRINHIQKKPPEVYRRRSVRKGVLKNFAKFTGKYLCQSPFFSKVVCLSLQLY